MGVILGPQVAYIYQNLSGRHLRVCQLDKKEKALNPLWRQENIESEASMLIPVPKYGGVIVVGQESISYHKSTGIYTAVTPFLINLAQICCYTQVEESQFLLGDIHGRLFMLILHTSDVHDKETVFDIKVSGA